MRLVGLLLLAAWMGVCSEMVVLRTGFSIKAKHYEKSGKSLILFTENGKIEIEEDKVAVIEHVSDPAPVIAALPSPDAKSVQEQKPSVPANPRKLVSEAAARLGLPPEIVHGLAQVESAYQVNAVSPKGAIGVMQLMPATAAALNADPRNVEQNIEAGVRHLADLLERYGGDVRKALAAYNAGAGAVDKYKGVPPYRETQAYVEKVIERYWRERKRAAAN